MDSSARSASVPSSIARCQSAGESGRRTLGTRPFLAHHSRVIQIPNVTTPAAGAPDAQASTDTPVPAARADAPMQSVLAVIAADFEAVNRLIPDRLASGVEMVREIGNYIVESGGKRLRPLLTLLSARAAGYDGPNAIPLAAVIEFLHTATLLHDDVVDMSELRRGRPTANQQWGNAPSVLVGDFLYSRAFQMMVEIGNTDVMAVLARATNVIAEGEVLQLTRIGDLELDEAAYLDVIYRKTAMLFEAATHAGALLSGAPAEIKQRLQCFGAEFGRAYQVVDDALDYVGDTEVMGKAVGDDLREGKLTLPLIHALRSGDPAQVALIRSAVRERSDAEADRIIGIVRDTGGIDYTRDVARRHSLAARECLDVLPASPHRDAMVRLVEIALDRQH